MIYIIHFDEPLAHARHYVGYYKRGNLKRRLEEHRSGRGARILQVCNERGITYRVVRLMEGDRNRERQIKNAKCTPRYCPECRKIKKRKHMNSFEVLAKDIHQNAVEKGFYEKPKNIGEMIALMHSELSEALEADRSDRYMTNELSPILDLPLDTYFLEAYQEHIKGTFEEEMADIVIRVLDLCAWKGIDIYHQILAKMRYNASREKYHGKKY